VGKTWKAVGLGLLNLLADGEAATRGAAYLEQESALGVRRQLTERDARTPRDSAERETLTLT
jgi:hypothetical protein